MLSALIVNADDWGYDPETTDRTLDCLQLGAVSSVSAMVFMADSERAAGIAREKGVDAGLHLNLSARFTGPNVSAALVHHQNKVAAYLTRHRFARLFYHPALSKSFAYTVQSQCEEYTRLYGVEPRRVDGHHHLHLSANVLAGHLLRMGIQVRRNFSFQPREKSIWNRYYRGIVDQFLARRHSLTDYLFALPPWEPQGRLERIGWLARKASVEVETHPVRREEYQFLTGGEVFRRLPGIPIVRGFPLLGDRFRFTR